VFFFITQTLLPDFLLTFGHCDARRACDEELTENLVFCEITRFPVNFWSWGSLGVLGGSFGGPGGPVGVQGGQGASWEGLGGVQGGSGRVQGGA